MGLIDEVGPGPVAIDTAIFIYFIEEDSRFIPHILPLFSGEDVHVHEHGAFGGAPGGSG